MKKSIVVIIGVFLLVVGCGGSRWTDARVEKHSHYTLRIQSQVEGGNVVKQHYRHPVDIDSQTIAAFMSELAYMEPAFLVGEAKKTSVFQDEEIARLSGPIAEALKTVDDNQRIAFSSLNFGGRLLFERSRETSGLIFVDPEGKLNIAFSGINVELPMDPEEAAFIREAAADPLDVREALTPLVATADYMENHLQNNGKPYPMWLKADLAKTRTAAKAIEAKPAAEKPAADPVLQRENIRSQLEYLKGLYDDGLISQSEYDAKRGELLKNLE